MRKCSMDEADVLIDRQPFQADTASEFEWLRQRGNLRGVEIVNLWRTTRRLVPGVWCEDKQRELFGS